MKIRVGYYGQAREITGVEREAIDVADAASVVDVVSSGPVVVVVVVVVASVVDVVSSGTVVVVGGVVVGGVVDGGLVHRTEPLTVAHEATWIFLAAPR